MAISDISRRAMKILAIISIAVWGLRVIFEKPEGLDGLFLGFLSIIVGLVYVVWGVLILSNSKSLQQLGAQGSIIVGLLIFISTLEGLFASEEIQAFSTGWDSTISVAQLLLALASGLFVFLSGSKSNSKQDKLIFIILIPVFFIIQNISSYEFSRPFEGIGWEAFIAMWIGLIIWLAVMYFSMLRYLIVIILGVSIMFTVTNAREVKLYVSSDDAYSSQPALQSSNVQMDDDNPNFDLTPEDFTDDFEWDFEEELTPAEDDWSLFENMDNVDPFEDVSFEYSASTVLKLLSSLALLGYSSFVLYRGRDQEQHSQNQGYSAV